MPVLLLALLSSSPQEWAPYRPAPADDRASYGLGLQLLNERKFGEATAVLNEVASRQPRWAEVFSARCSAQLGLKRPDSALADCRYALQVKPELVVALYGLATAERALGRNADAAAHFRQYASSKNPDATAELKAEALKAANALEPHGATASPPRPPEPETEVARAPSPGSEPVRRPAVARSACKDGEKPCSK